MKLPLLLCLALLSLLASFGTAETEVNFTPNVQDQQNDGSGPLPMSQAQRDQLTELEQAIMQSPDPQSTLMQVAQNNQMDPQELVNMLERNRADRQQAGGGGGGSRQVKAWPQQVMKIMTAMGVVLSQAAAKNPRAFSVLALSLLCLFYIGIMAPRNGLVISSSPGLLSKGHTTWWSPPTKYVDRFLDSRQFGKKVTSIKEKRLDLGDIEITEDGVEWHTKLGRKAKLTSAATAQATIYLEDFIPEELLEEKEEEEIEAIRDEVADVLYQQAAANVLTSRRFTEFTESKLRFQSSNDSRQRSGVLVLPKSGDWGRYGVQSLKVAQQSEGETYVQIKYSTLKGGVFDGQVHLLVEQTKAGDVVVQVHALIPKKGRKLKKGLATTLVSSMTSSIVRSIQTEANQRLARQLQGKRFSQKAKSRATERRHFRHEKEKQLEEMAEDRRRKWQRGNPDAGRYRPSGDRMKSPNNC
jgi:hypothetical protein